MPPLLYLDTARLGQMTPAAKDAQLDFVRLSAEEPSSLYFEEFLREGFAAWPLSYQHRFPGLSTWTGIAGLKHSIRRLAGAPDNWQVLLAGRSLSLVQRASNCLFRVCHNVLATDLSWPTYQQVVDGKANRTGNRITTVPLRDEILYRSWTVDDVVRHLAHAFTEHHCDGLFLPAVDHLGIRLPIKRIVEQIRARSELRFCLIDAAQAFCQIPLGECVEVADFIVAGSHKWMGAYLPMGIGLFGKQPARGSSRTLASLWAPNARGADPLLHFTQQMDGGCLDGHSETANLAPLMACAGAVHHHTHPPRNGPIATPVETNNLPKTLPRPAEDWYPCRPDKPFQSRIFILHTDQRERQQQSADALRRMWLESGYVVTAYAGGKVRIAWPPETQYLASWDSQPGRCPAGQAAPGSAFARSGESRTAAHPAHP